MRAEKTSRWSVCGVHFEQEVLCVVTKKKVALCSPQIMKGCTYKRALSADATGCHSDLHKDWRVHALHGEDMKHIVHNIDQEFGGLKTCPWRWPWCMWQ